MAEIGAAIATFAAWLGGTSASALIFKAVVVAATVAVQSKAASDQRKAAKRAQLESQQRNAYRNFRQPLTPRRILYGRVRVAGPLVFAHNRIQNEAHLVVALAGHEIDAIETYHILKDDLPVDLTPGATYGRVSGKYANNVIIWPYLGTSAQNIGAKMRTATDVRPTGGGVDINLPFVTVNDRFAGIAALYVVTVRFGVDFDGQSPDFAATVRGKKVYDPRTETTYWSQNPALCAADYLVSYMGYPWEAIDIPALIASADVCDDDVPLKAGGTEKRYECNGVLGAEIGHAENLETLSQCMAGDIRYASGRWIIEAGFPRTPSMAIDESMVLENYQVSFNRPDNALPNAVRGNFVSAEDWQPTSYPSRTDAAAVAAEGVTNWLDVDLPLTTSPSMAQRIAKISLARARSEISLSIPLDLRGILVRPGDVIAYSSPEIGIVSRPFQVDSQSFARSTGNSGPILTTRLDLVSYDAAAYDWDAEEEETEIVTGEATVDSIVSKYFGNDTVDETDLSTSPSFSADYVFFGTMPSITQAPLISIDITLEIDITTDIGGTETTTTHTVETTYTLPDPRAKTFTVTVPVDIAHPVGSTYVTHNLIVATIMGRYENNTTTPPQQVTEI